VFTGIVRDVGTLTESEERPGEGRRLTMASEALGTWRRARSLDVGSSVAVDGVCLTVVAFGEGSFTVDASDETLTRTTLSERAPGDAVNLEPSLRVGDEVGGHFVLGHVDTTVTVVSLEDRGDFYDLDVRIPPAYRRYVAPKGCVALDGISLTVNEVSGEGIARIRIVPHTYRETALSERFAGASMNLEVDMLARYLYHQSGEVSDALQSVPPHDAADEARESAGREGTDGPES